jgi:DNA repair protein RadA/Sms
MAKIQSVYICQSCGAQTPRWQGRCPECGEWNSLVEEKIQKVSTKTFSKNSRTVGRLGGDSAVKGYGVPRKLFDELNSDVAKRRRISSGMSEFDRVLGEGFVPGSLLLFGGEPGIGKSTLLLQVLGHLASHEQLKCLYISGEESGPQVASRAARLKVHKSETLQFLGTTDLEEAIHALELHEPHAIVVDSVQTLAAPDLESAAGTVSQVRRVTQVFMDYAKGRGALVLLVGHVTKEGVVAGPRLLEHMVDGVFYFENSTSGAYRMLRGQKNRFGATHELAVFEMNAGGLTQVENPSQRFLMERAKESPGSAVVAHMEGSRPFLTEVQSLTQKCYAGYPRRTVQGVDQNRISLLLAVIDRSLGMNISDYDVYCKVASGARIDEPASDLAILCSLLSAAQGRVLPADAIYIGEVGLGGELRSVSAIAARLNEAKTVGIKRAFIPAWNAKEARDVKDIHLVECRNVRDVLASLGNSLGK